MCGCAPSPVRFEAEKSIRKPLLDRCPRLTGIHVYLAVEAPCGLGDLSGPWVGYGWASRKTVSNGMKRMWKDELEMKTCSLIGFLSDD